MELKNWLTPRWLGGTMSEEVEEGMFTAVGDPENPNLVESKVEDVSQTTVVEEWKPSPSASVRMIEERKRSQFASVGTSQHRKLS